MQDSLTALLKNNQPFHPVVPFNAAADKLVSLDFTANNTDLTPELLGDIQVFTQYVNQKLHSKGALYGIGGYGEHRTIYSRSEVFDSSPWSDSTEDGKNHRLQVNGSANKIASQRFSFFDDEDVLEAPEPRRLHLGTDIWGPVHTKVMAPLDGIVHSFGYHPALGNYGTVIILVHQLAGVPFYTLYGHLSYGSIGNLYEGQHITQGDVFAEFGIQQDNGCWPPHLHFQVMRDLNGWKGDYPGVCAYSEKEQWMQNCVDPDLILNLNRYLA
jgi:murein DD-endopeptidase MepM/ murein hydrolase activator NlpD